MADMGNTELNYCYSCMARLESGQTLCPVCGNDNSVNQNPPNTLPEGTILAGKYLVGRVLGQGGFGITYIGVNLHLKMRAAIKEYFPITACVRSSNLAGVVPIASDVKKETFRSGLDEFQAEAERLAAIDSPNIVKVMDFFRENGTSYIVMDYLDGNSLSKEVSERGGRLPWQEIPELFGPLILEIDKLHKDHLLHRDIKPDNIKVVRDNDGNRRLVLLDFGSARNFASADKSGSYTAYVTAGYAPYEQYIRRGKQGPYTDIYSVCATMYAAISGQVPIEATARKSGEAELQDLAELGIDVPKRISRAIMHGLAVDSRDRPQSMRELYDELYAEEVPADAGEEPEEPPAEDPEPALYAEGKRLMSTGSRAGVEQALKLFGQISGYKDADSLAEVCRRKIVPEAPAPKAAKKIWGIILAVVLAAAAGILLFSKLPGRREPGPAETAAVMVPAGPGEPPAETAAGGSAKDAPEQTQAALAETQRVFDISETEAVLRETQAALDMRLTNAAAAETQAAEPTATVMPTETLADTVTPTTTAAAAPSATASPVPAMTNTPEPTAAPVPKSGMEVSTAKEGDILTLGQYEQDGNLNNGAEAIEWQVLAVEDGRALLISRYGLDAQQYYTEKNTNVTWETSTLRAWLNGEFYNSAFSNEEKERIREETVKNPDNSEYGMPGGNDTADRIFLLSIDEARQYFADNEARQCLPTAYAKKNKAFVWEDHGGLTWWWLRSPGDNPYTTADVATDGHVHLNGSYATESYGSVRPAFWLELPAGTNTASVSMLSDTPEPTLSPGALYDLGKAAYDDGDYAKALEYLLPAAEAGHAAAQNQLGRMYEKGYGMDRSYEEAVRWYRLSADQGYAAAQFHLGVMYDDGKGVDQSLEEAARWYRLAAEQGYADAQYDLGTMYYFGDGVEQSFEEAARWYRLAAEQGNEYAQNNLGVMYSNGYGVERSYEESLKWFRQSAEQGNAYAQNSMGWMYENGFGTDQSYEEAVKWYRLAAEQGDAGAQYNLGWMYAHGTGVEPSYEEALKWYQLAADQGSADAQANLGEMYAIGSGVDRSYEEALKWYQQAARQDNAAAQFGLGRLYENGQGVGQSYEEALKWYRLAAAQGYAAAQNSLGWMYENGYGVDRSYDEAVKWYRLAAAQGYADGLGNLGWMYLAGTGIEQSYEEAFRCFQQAAGQGNPTAQYNLGLMYENGQGVDRSYEEAVKWYKLAADQGQTRAQNKLTGLLDQYPELQKVIDNMTAVTDTAAPTAAAVPTAAAPSDTGAVPTTGTEAGDVKVGDVIPLGHYEQDGNTANGAEAIEWQVLAVENGRALVISRYSLDAVPYNTENQNVTWETSTLRAWLNGEFFSSAFSEAEQGRIREITLKNPDNPSKGTAGGKDTTDRIFLLSIEEAEQYFPDDEARKSRPTAYAVSRGAGDKDSDAVWWWLRSPGSSPKNAAGVNNGGTVRDGGGNVNYSSGTARPAFWLDLTVAKKPGMEIGKVNVGDIITLGQYEQDGDLTNGTEAIEWQVLTVEEDRALVISKYGLDVKPYNDIEESVTWETCTLRAWLNGEFYNSVFSEEEKKWIREVAIKNPDNAEWGTIGGNDTVDRIFLLSIDEAEQYFANNEERKCWPTIYAENNEAYAHEDYGRNSWWWFRSPGGNDRRAATGDHYGDVHVIGHYVFFSDTLVRPAFWLDLTAAEKPGTEIGKVNVGDIITLGQYEQDGDLTNGAEAIEWQVLTVEDDRALVISKYGLDVKPYNEEYTDVTWETCTLRAWLNGEFYNSAFDEDEKSHIQEVRIKNPDNAEYGTNGGKDTTDRIFLLSVDEAEEYFVNDEKRKCWPTAYAKNNGAIVSENNPGMTWWWLRSPGYFDSFAVDVYIDGRVNGYGNDVDSRGRVVRPAFWLEL